MVAVVLGWASQAFAFDNSACWHYAAQQGARPDVTCTKIDLPLLESLQGAGRGQVEAVMDEPGVVYPDGTLRYVGNDLNDDGGYQGQISLTFGQDGRVAAIDAQLDNPDQGGAYFEYRWRADAGACSDLPGGPPACQGP